MSRFVVPIVLFAALILGGCSNYHLSGRQGPASSVLASADDGDAVSQRIAGDMYYWGESVPRSWPLAQFYWELAAAQGDEVALQRLENWQDGEAIHVVSDGATGREFFGSTSDYDYNRPADDEDIL